jgi:polysaccharide export outer membrane protein
MFQRQMGSEVRVELSGKRAARPYSGRSQWSQWRSSLCVGVAAILFAPAIVCLAQNAEKKPDTAPVSSPAASVQAQAAATSQAQPAGVASVDAAHYIIGSEDTLQVTVWKEPSLSGTIPVRPDGRISLVLVGDMQAAGRNPMQLADDITVKLKKYIQDPNVSVVVMSVNSQKIFLVGEVGHVGPVMMSAGMTPLQAIAAGGGLTPYANAKKIYILRGEAGKQLKIPFNYKQALKGDNSQSVELKPGDTIVVP